MSDGVRLTEKWMRYALWLVAFVFAGFLIGLGSQVVDNLADVEPAPSVEKFVDQAKAEPLRLASDEAKKAREKAGEDLEQAEHKHKAAQANTRSSREAFDNWVATRQVTLRPDQDSELIKRTHALDQLVEDERRTLAVVEAQQQIEIDARQAEGRATKALEALYAPAYQAVHDANERADRKVFAYRIGLTVPLLIVAGWLFKNKRNGTYWPFAWGFIFFALFAFFVELVPYLPSYGGYVRYGVGIVLTVFGGRYAIRWLQGWIERQKEVEALPQEERRTTMRYDIAMERIGKCLCPSCERPTDFKDPTLNHCPHCGIGLFDRCPVCTVRKDAFKRFCFSCGTPGSASLAD